MDLKLVAAQTSMSEQRRMNFLQLLCGCIIGNRRRRTMTHCSDNIEANIPCFVRLPDCRVYQVHVSKNARGQDCLYKVCDILGIVETDYFGLCFKDKYGLMWLNKRVLLRHQLKDHRPPYLLDMRVKFYVPPDSLQQKATRELFYLQLRADMKCGDLSVPESRVGLVGALLAQSEMGNPPEASIPPLIYPPYFAKWEQGYPRRIALEHRKLNGLCQDTAKDRVVVEAAKLDEYGVCNFIVKNCEGHLVRVGIGGRSVRVNNLSVPENPQRIPYHLMIEASYHSNKWKIKYKAVNPGHENLATITLELKAFHQKQAYMMFRFLTEDHTFLTQNTVDDRVLNHFEREGFHCLMRHVLLNRPMDRKYHFDVLRTQREAFQCHWRKLHQMSTDLRQVETVDGSQQEVVEEEDTSDHSHSGNDLTEGVNPDTGGHGPQGQPTLTEIEAAFESPVRRGRLSRWRTRILSRRRGHDGNISQSDSNEPNEPGESMPTRLPPSLQAGASVAGGGNIIEEENGVLLTSRADSQSPSVLETTHEEAVGAEGGVERSDMTHEQESEEAGGEDPLPLWLSFSPSVEHFVKGIMEATSDEEQPSSFSEQLEVPSCSSRCLEPVRSRRQGTKRVSASIGLEPRITTQNLSGVHQEECTYSDESASSGSESGRRHKSGVSSSSKKMAADKTRVVGLSQESLNVIKPFMEKINDNFTCKICMDRFVSVTFCPCGHYVSCRQCAEMLTVCPLCRAVITHTMQVYQ